VTYQLIYCSYVKIFLEFQLILYLVFLLRKSSVSVHASYSNRESNLKLVLQTLYDHRTFVLYLVAHI